MRVLTIVLWGMVAAAIVGFGYLTLAPDPPQTERISGIADIGGPFALVDQNGERVTHSDLEGKPYAIFFGFTYCPDVCPTTLFEISAWIDQLGPHADSMNFVFVTIDPERDTPNQLADYMGSFSDRIIALTGSQADIDQITRHYRVYSQRVPLDDGDYTMDHTASIILMNAEGSFAGTIGYGESESMALGKLRHLAGAT